MTDTLTIPIPSKDPNISGLHEYIGLGRVPSSCNLDIWLLEDERAVVLFTEVNHGTSVTNAAETLVEEIYNKYLEKFDKDKCLFMETYSERPEHVDQIVPTWDGDQVISVNWVHIGKRINQ